MPLNEETEIVWNKIPQKMKDLEQLRARELEKEIIKAIKLH